MSSRFNREDWSEGSIQVEKNLYGKVVVRKICSQILVDK